MRKALGRWGVRLLLFLLVTLAIQAVVFYAIARHSFASRPADLAVLFKGDEGRIAFFYKLIEKENIKQIHIPGVSETTLTTWSRKFKVPATLHLPATPATGSTFEDALIAADAIQANGIRSVLLVTSDYHIPRSWFLLRVLTMGQEVAIQPVEVPSRMQSGSLRHQAKLIYNEVFNFWGSMAELVYYKGTGQLLFKNHKAAGFIASLKEILLFDGR